MSKTASALQLIPAQFNTVGTHQNGVDATFIDNNRPAPKSLALSTQGISDGGYAEQAAPNTTHNRPVPSKENDLVRP